MKIIKSGHLIWIHTKYNTNYSMTYNEAEKFYKELGKAISKPLPPKPIGTEDLECCGNPDIIRRYGGKDWFCKNCSLKVADDAAKGD